MLTFFEYLRQRAFESVLSGAQEALQSLERDGAFDNPALTPKSHFKGDQQAPLLHKPNAAAQHSAASESADRNKQSETGDSDQRPAPRLRSRPNRKGSRKK